MEKLKFGTKRCVNGKSMILKKIAPLVMLLVLDLSAYYFIRRANVSGKVPKLRRLVAVAAMDEAVGRCAEMGRPVHICPGSQASLRTYKASQTMAGMSVLSYITRLAARYGITPIVTMATAETIPLVVERMREAYTQEGEADKFDSVTSVRYIASGYAGIMSGQMGIIGREKPAANILVGPFSWETLPVLEEGKRVGAINIGGTVRLSVLHFFAVACDYVLISEEIYAAGAYLSGDPVSMSSIAGQDVGKIFAAIILIVATLALTFGSDLILNLLKM